MTGLDLLDKYLTPPTEHTTTLAAGDVRDACRVKHFMKGVEVPVWLNPEITWDDIKEITTNNHIFTLLTHTTPTTTATEVMYKHGNDIMKFIDEATGASIISTYDEVIHKLYDITQMESWTDMCVAYLTLATILWCDTVVAKASKVEL